MPSREPGASRWLVGPIVEPLIERLAERSPCGWCFATVEALRIMAYVDTGHVYGNRSIARWIRKRTRAGGMAHRRIMPGAHIRGVKRPTVNGTCLNRPPTEAERREARWRERLDRRRQRRERARRLEAERQAAAQLARTAARSQRRAEQLVRAPDPVEPVAGAAEARDAIASVLAALGNPPELQGPRELGEDLELARHLVDVDAPRPRLQAPEIEPEPEPPDQ